MPTHPASLHPGANYLLCLPPQPPIAAACLVVTLLAQAPCPAVVIVADEHHRRFLVDRRCLYALAEPAPSPPPPNSRNFGEGLPVDCLAMTGND